MSSTTENRPCESISSLISVLSNSLPHARHFARRERSTITSALQGAGQRKTFANRMFASSIAGQYRRPAHFRWGYPESRKANHRNCKFDSGGSFSGCSCKHGDHENRHPNRCSAPDRRRLRLAPSRHQRASRQLHDQTDPVGGVRCDCGGGWTRGVIRCEEKDAEGSVIESLAESCAWNLVPLSKGSIPRGPIRRAAYSG